MKRDLEDNEIEYNEIQGDYDVYDAHNSISLGIDKNGYLHMSYNQHKDQLQYRRSIMPLSIEKWTSEIPMTGKNED